MQAALWSSEGKEKDSSKTLLLEAVDYWEAKRTVDVLFGSRWENLSEA